MKKIKYNLKILVEFFNANPEILQIWCKYSNVNETRIKLLCEIFGGLDQLQSEEIKEKIFHYGSLIGTQDLIERQLFVWLLVFVEDRCSLSENKTEGWE